MARKKKEVNPNPDMAQRANELRLLADGIDKGTVVGVAFAFVVVDKETNSGNTNYQFCTTVSPWLLCGAVSTMHTELGNEHIRARKADADAREAQQ